MPYIEDIESGQLVEVSQDQYERILQARALFRGNVTKHDQHVGRIQIFGIGGTEQEEYWGDWGMDFGEFAGKVSWIRPTRYFLPTYQGLKLIDPYGNVL